MSKCISDHKCSLTSLYASVDTRNQIVKMLEVLFKQKFTGLLKEASAFRPFLVCPSNYYEKEIKDLFIEEGQQLDSIEDLEFVLNNLNFLKFSDFRRAKENFEKGIEFMKNIEKEKRVKFKK